MSDLLTAILLLAPIVDWATVVMLAYISRQAPEVRSLRERLWVASAIAIATTVVAAFLINARWLHLDVPSNVSAVVLVGAIVAPSVINGLWLIQGWRGDW